MEGSEVDEVTVSETEVAVLDVGLVAALVEWLAVVSEVAVGEEFAEDATVAAVVEAAACRSTGIGDMASWPMDTYWVCHSYRMGMAEDRHY